MATEGWVKTEIEHGRFKVTSDKGLEIQVFSDFSGQVTNVAGDFFQFEDLRDFIEAAKILEEALNQHYGGWK